MKKCFFRCFGQISKFVEKLSVIVQRPRCKLDFVETKLADKGPYLKASYLDLLLFPREWPSGRFPLRTVHGEHPLEVKRTLTWADSLLDGVLGLVLTVFYPATKSNLKIHTWVYSQHWGKTEQNNTLKSFLLCRNRKSWPNREYECLSLVERPRKSNPAQLGQIFLGETFTSHIPRGLLSRVSL